MGLYSDNAQRTSKGGENISHATRLRLVAYFFVLTTFFVLICALSEYRRTAKWNLFVKYIPAVHEPYSWIFDIIQDDILLLA